MSISWGMKERFKFTAAGNLASWDPPPVAGIYAITSKSSPDRPKSHTILFVGESASMAQEAHELNRQVIDAWKDSGQDIRDLNVFIHVMPGSASHQRTKIKEQLISEYRPRCNR